MLAISAPLASSYTRCIIEEVLHMNTETAVPATASAVVSPVVTEELTAALKLIDTVQRDYWPPADLDTAQEKIGAFITAANLCNLSVIHSFDLEQDFPEGYGLSIAPITKNDAQRGRVKIGLLIGALPDPALLAETEKGEKFIRDTVIAKCLSQLTNAVRPRADGTSAASVPFTPDDFISSSRDAESLATFRELAPDYVNALKTQGLTIMTVQILRQVLASAAFASQQFPHIPATSWSGLLSKMIAKAERDKKDAGIMAYWDNTRDNVEVDVGTFDLDGIDTLIIAADDKAAKKAAEEAAANTAS